MHTHKTVRKWNDDDKNWWSRRSGLEKNLIILLIVIGVLSIGFLIYFSITRSAVSAEICNTPGCLLAASEIIAHMDTTIDPCDDFYKFTCGKFIEDTHGDAEAISKLDIDALIERQLQEIVEEPVKDEDHYLIKSQKQLFQACLNQTAIEKESLGIFKETLKELRGWPVVVGYHWKAKLFDWQDMIYELRARGYDYSMMLSVHAAKERMDLSEFSVVIAEPTVESVKDQHKDLYIKYMVDVAVAFGAERQLASNEMEQVYDFMEELEKITNESYYWRLDNNNETYYNWTADEVSRTFTVNEFQSNHNEMDWFEFINTIIAPLASISSDDYVLFPNPEFINKFFYLLYRTLKRTQANYIIWMVLQDIMPYMPKELKHIQANYTCSTVQQSPIQDRLEFCKEVIDDSFLPGPTDITYARRHLSEEQKVQVEELFGNIKSQLSTSIMETTWMDEESKENSSAKVDAITGIIGFDEDYFNDTIFEKLVLSNDSLEDFGNDSFFNMLLKSRKRLMDTWYYQISLPANESDMHLNMIASKLYILYSGAKNTLIITPKILQGAYYNEDKPKYLNYGAIGSLIGQHLMSGFDEDLWTEETTDAYNEHMKCFARNVENFDNSETNTAIEARLSLVDDAGVQLAYAAYKNWVEENAEEPQLPGLEYTPNQLFWISVMIPRCYTLPETALNSVSIAEPMVNNPDFADDFSCSADSRMNPTEKCQIF